MRVEKLRVNHRWTFGGALFLGALGLFSCESESIADPRRNVLQHWVDQSLITDYRALKVSAEELDRQAQAYCQAPSVEAWSRLQKAWWNARAPWKRSETFAFGPYADNPWRLGAKIDFWPARPASIDKVLENQALELTPQFVARLGASTTGMPALEYILFRATPNPNINEARRCAYLQGLTYDLIQDSNAMLQAWSPEGANYRAELIFANQESLVFEDLDDAMAEVVNRIGFTLENIRRDKLAAVLGKGPGKIHPEAAESRFSGRSLEDIRDNLRGIEMLIFGPAGHTQIQGLALNRSEWTGLPTNLVQMLEYRGIYLGQELAARLSACYAALDAIEVPLSEAAARNPQLLRAAIDRLGEFQQLIQTRVLDGLSLTITFNDADGD